MPLPKKYFFGWTNFKYVVRNVYYTFSDKPCYLSRKRIESCFLFLGAYGTLIFYIIKRINEDAPFGEMLALTGTVFFYAGYQMAVIQKEKRENTTP